MELKPGIGILTLLAVTSVFTAGPVLSQTPAAGKKLTFEVAAIKANTRIGPSALDKAGSRLLVTALPLRTLIMEAYRVRDFQIIGGAPPANRPPWDIEAQG